MCIVKKLIRKYVIYMEWVSYILSAVSLILFLGASLIKGKKINLILIMLFAGNALLGIGYLISGGINGAASSFLGAIVTIINYFFTRDGKKIPVWLSICYAIIFTIVNIIAANGLSFASTLVIITAYAYIMCIAQENGKMYRVWATLNVVVWCIYDLTQHQSAQLLQHSVQLLITLIGMIIYDRKKENKI